MGLKEIDEAEAQERDPDAFDPTKWIRGMTCRLISLAHSTDETV